MRNANGVITLPSLSSSLALEDEVLDAVEQAWSLITRGEGGEFMMFDAREGVGEDD